MKSPIASKSAARGESNGSSILRRIFADHACDIIVTGKIAAIGCSYSCINFADLPCVQCDIILDRLGREPTARALGLLGKPIQLIKRGLVEF